MFDAQTAAAREAVNLDQQPHSPEDVELLYRIYLEKRIESQIDFYQSRVRENQINADFTFTLGAVVMGLSSLVATISAAGQYPTLSLLSAILPAFAALLASFRQLYGWERQTSIYRDALLGLERVKLMTPDEARRALVDIGEVYPRLVNSSETVFTAEVNQWGQYVQTGQKPDEESHDGRVFNTMIGETRLTDAQIESIRKILAAGLPRKPYTENIIVTHDDPAGHLESGTITPIDPEAEDDAQETTIIPEEFAADAGSVPPPTDFIAISDIEAPPQESEESLAPGAEYTEVLSGDAADQMDFYASTRYDSVPPPETESALKPGSIHTDTPPAEAPPDDPDAIIEFPEEPRSLA